MNLTLRKVLIIDDDPNVTKLLRIKLEARGGIQTAEISRASEAAARALEFQPQLIVCDIDLGTMDGGEVAQQLSSDPVTAAIPIVYLSSLITPQDMDQRSGGRKLISKKLPFPEIIELIVQELPPG